MSTTAEKIFDLYKDQHSHAMFASCAENSLDGIVDKLQVVIKNNKKALCKAEIKNTEINFVEIIKAMSQCLKPADRPKETLAAGIQITDVENKLILEDLIKAIERKKSAPFHLIVLNNISNTPATLFWSRWFFGFIAGSYSDWIVITNNQYLADYMHVESNDRHLRKVAATTFCYPMYKVTCRSRRREVVIVDFGKQSLHSWNDIYPLKQVATKDDRPAHTAIFEGKYFFDTKSQKLYCISTHKHSVKKTVLGTLENTPTLTAAKRKAAKQKTLNTLLPEIKTLEKEVEKSSGAQIAKDLKAKINSLLAMGSHDVVQITVTKGRKKRADQEADIVQFKDRIVKITLPGIEKEYLLLM